jgi:predicted dehydrogenase
VTHSVAVIGCGWSGLGSQLDELRPKPASHAEAAALNPKTDLVALVDNHEESLELAERLYPGVPRFSTVAEMLSAARPSIVVIATDPDSHGRLVRESAQGGVDAIVCEKPLSHDLEEGRAVVAECRELGVPLFVNHMRRFDPLIRRYREYVAGGYVRDTFLGPIRAATAYYDKGLMHGGTHIVDLLRYFLGEPAWVTGVENPFIEAAPGDVAIDGLIGFEGAHAALQAFDSPDYSLTEMSFFGERGRLNLNHMWGLEIEIVGTRSCDDVSAYRELDDARKRTVGERRSFFAPILDHVIASLEGAEKPLSTGEDALRALEILVAMRRSAQGSGERIELPPAGFSSG